MCRVKWHPGVVSFLLRHCGSFLELCHCRHSHSESAVYQSPLLRPPLEVTYLTPPVGDPQFGISVSISRFPDCRRSPGMIWNDLMPLHQGNLDPPKKEHIN